jgi:3-deoxy-D-manno-octulosonate 8-phosphate phosphatase (KDO 8-P phosphatase)
MQGVRLLLLDVDGVLTGGEIIYADNGDQIKHFNVKDGVGIRMLMKAGIRVGIITGRSSAALRHRCDNLGIDLVYDGVADKVEVLKRIVDQQEFSTEQIAFLGDDLPDLGILKRVGLAAAVADAHELVRKAVHLTTSARGGQGAVREISEMILKAQDKWDELIRRLFDA